MNELNIKQANNGFIVSWTENWSNENKEDIRQCSEVIEDDNDEKDCIKRLLEFIAEYFGCDYDRFGKENLNIKFNKEGHKC